jgi:hypothetical protein
MACDLSTIKSAACLSGIGKEQSKIKLLQLIAQLTCEASEGGGSGDSLPSGVILMWSGTIATIPSGWTLCDGTAGTPDLRNRFVVCANADTVGVPTSTILGPPLSFSGSVSHTHNLTDPGHDHLYPEELSANVPGTTGIVGYDAGAVAANTTGITVDMTSNVPPFFALAYIMKT